MDSEEDEPSARIGSVLVASSQQEEPSSEPPRKRRRTAQLLPDSDDDEESDSQASEASETLPTSDYIDVDDDLAANQSKYEHVLHEPAYVETQKNSFVTQVEQPWSSPTRIRGPRWRKQTPSPSPSPEEIPIRPQQTIVQTTDNFLVAEDFDDDEIEALMASQDLDVRGLAQSFDADVPTLQRQSSKSMRQTTLFGIHTTQRESQNRPNASQTHNWPLAQRNEPPTHHKLNEEAMQKWIFPLNVGTIRDYQYNIVHKALYNNILVALPTGLGKTFIAAAVMMNWYNWTQDAQIVFMAPTKPLAAQQIAACFNIAGIPRSQTTLMTGEISPVVRGEEWKSKRVFFMTPQTMINDLKTGMADPKRIVLVVVDEAHRATGNYAYVEVVRFLRRFNNSFRVLALTATPGSDVEAVQKVIDGLDIARVEIRTEESMDIQAFIQPRRTELEVFDYSDEIKMCLDLFSKALQPVVDKLCSQNASWSRDPLKITQYGLMQAQKQWMSSEAGRKANQGIKGMIRACFMPMISLAHCMEFLKFYGIGLFYHKLKGFRDDASGKYAKMITESPHFATLMSRMQAWINKDDFVGHPKLGYLKEVVLNHFMDAGEGVGRAAGRPPSDTRIMIFAHFRDSAEEIVRVLNKHQPIVRAHVFVGQSNTAGSDGMNQKKQNEIVDKFKSGTYNTIVATSIGEEGLDIGEVDLIVCYDCFKSPLRMLQRMGRTGRKRAGNIVMLLMRDKEEQAYYKAKDNYEKMQVIIESGKEFIFHTDRSPRIVPKGIMPAVSKEVIEIPIENTQPGSVEPSRSKGKNKKRPAKKFNMPDGVETGFKFLGSKTKDKKTPQQKPAKPKKRTYIDEDDALTPSDSEVLLTVQQEEDLADRYASVASTEDQQIDIVEVSRNPEKVRATDKTRLVGHSMTTHRVLKAFRAGRDSRKYLDRPHEPSSEDLDIVYGRAAPTVCEEQVPFYVSQQEGVPVASQAEALPELNNLFEPAPSTKKATANQVKKRTKRKIVSDDDDD